MALPSKSSSFCSLTAKQSTTTDPRQTDSYGSQQLLTQAVWLYFYRSGQTAYRSQAAGPWQRGCRGSVRRRPGAAPGQPRLLPANPNGHPCRPSPSPSGQKNTWWVVAERKTQTQARSSSPNSRGRGGSREEAC